MKARFYGSNGMPRNLIGWLQLEGAERERDKPMTFITKLQIASIRQERKIDEIGYMVAAINSGMAANGMYQHMGVEPQPPELPVPQRNPVGFGSILKP